MAELMTSPQALDEGFSQENISRIYEGIPALIDGREPAEVLTDEQFAVLRGVAHGLEIKQIEEIVERRGVTFDTAANILREGCESLGITHRVQIAGYFPLNPDHALLQNTMLADLGPGRLDTLQGLSIGLSCDQLDSSYTLSTRTHYAGSINKAWPHVRNAVTGVAVANALRAKYIKAIEGPTRAVSYDDPDKLTLPELEKAEPFILKAIEARAALRAVGMDHLS
ncbi:MAG TPA: hypothetical protein VD706_02165 [Candidatus Saccharimonadales bacterium]|nr:hypothetical protein [Candidatus Saccharimonadales bacterium]